MSSSADSETTAGSLRVAVIGYGLAGSVFHAPLIDSPPGMSVAAIVTSNPERQERAYRDFPTAIVLSSADQLWLDSSLYDLVVLAAPNRSHVPLRIATMNAAFPVVIDKPMPPSLNNPTHLTATTHPHPNTLPLSPNHPSS